MTKEKIQNNNGFVLLYVVIISSMILAITLAVSDIALKEIKFGTSAKDTNNAFFAADVGSECALYYDKAASTVFVSPNNPTINCNSASISVTENPLSFWSFTISRLGNDNQGCVKVTVDKTATPTVVISRGYNTGGSVGGACTPGVNSTERQLELRY